MEIKPAFPRIHISKWDNMMVRFFLQRNSQETNERILLAASDNGRDGQHGYHVMDK